ncbi:hypothetical protein WN943_023856 [Citrus x changshan-huyou]
MFNDRERTMYEYKSEISWVAKTPWCCTTLQCFRKENGQNGAGLVPVVDSATALFAFEFSLVMKCLLAVRAMVGTVDLN